MGLVKFVRRLRKTKHNHKAAKKTDDLGEYSAQKWNW